MKKGMIFIDGSNVFYDWNKIKPQENMDIEKYISLVQSKYSDIDFVRTYYFATESSNNKSFLQTINRIPYCQVVRGRLQEKTIVLNDKSGIVCANCGKPVISGAIKTHTDKGTDVNIAVEMLKHAYNNSYDIAVLISRDADFAGVVRIIKNLGKTVELVLFENEKGNAEELTDTVDKVELITSQEYALCVYNK